MNSEITKKSIPPFFVSEDSLKPLCALLDNLSGGNSPVDDRILQYKLFSEDEFIITSDSDVFLRRCDKDKLKKVEMIFKSKHKRIQINIDFVNSRRSKLVISGSNPSDINSITTDICNAFSEPKYVAAYIGRQKAFLIYIAFTAFISLPLSILFYNMSNTSDPFVSNYILIFFLILAPSLIGWNRFFKWLYPKHIHRSIFRYRSSEYQLNKLRSCDAS